MPRASLLSPIASWTAVASAPLALACLYTALAAAGFDLAALDDPAASVRGGAQVAELLRVSMILDALGYYLLIAPAVILLGHELRAADDGLASLLTASGLGYVLVGAIGASVLAAVCPPLVIALEGAAGAERDAITLVLGAAFDAVHGGLWNFLEMILGAVFWLGAGALLRAKRPRFAVLTIVLGIAAAADALGEVTRVPALASAGLTAYSVLAPLWALCFGLLTWRERVTRP